MAAVAVAQAARFTGDKQHAAVASQAVLRLLAFATAGPERPGVPRAGAVVTGVQQGRVRRAGRRWRFTSCRPRRAAARRGEGLCTFLRTRTRLDGSVHYTDGPNDDCVKLDPAGANEYPGLALQALAASNRLRPGEWKKDAVKRGVTHYHAAFRARPHPLLVATVVPAAAELHLQTKLPEAATAAFEMADWLSALQIGANDGRALQWAGGFRAVADGRTTDAAPLTADTGRCVQALACAYQLTRATGDLAREAKLRPAVGFAVQFLCGAQFVEANTRHFEDNFRGKMLIGAFHLSPTDGNLRIDATACAVTGLLRFLASGAQTSGQ
jgi:hypothetical protein